MLSALVVVQTFGVGQALVIDARIVGLMFAVILLLIRAPFIVVIFGAAAIAAILRYFPIVKPGVFLIFLIANKTPGINDSLSNESCRIVKVSPIDPKTTS